MNGEPLLDAVRLACRAAGVERGDVIDIALSGGPDSTAMCVLLGHVAPTLGCTLRAHHIRHGLRDDRADVEVVRRLAKRLSLELIVTEVDTTVGQGLEDQARRARYDALLQVADGHARWIAVGHTVDDDIENHVIRWVRGAGLEGMAGMRGVRQLGPQVSLLRPLLQVQRADIHAWLAMEGIESAHDPSNEDSARLRNRVRSRVLGELLGLRTNAAQTMARSLRLLRRDADALVAATEILVNEGTMTDGPAWYLSRERFMGLGRALGAQVLRHATRRVVSGHQVSAHAIDAALDAIHSPPRFGHAPWDDGTVTLGRQGRWAAVWPSDVAAVSCTDAAPLHLGDVRAWGALSYQVIRSTLVSPTRGWVVSLTAPVERYSWTCFGELALSPAFPSRRRLRENLRAMGVPSRWVDAHPVLVGPDLAWLVGCSQIHRLETETHEKTSLLVVHAGPWYVDSPVRMGQ